MKTRIFKALTLILAFAVLCVPAVVATNLTIDQILNNAYDSTNHSLSLSLSTSTNKDSTAYTNVPTYPLALQHETSGTPTTGIGVGLEFVQETSASNNETVGSAAAVMTDTTAGSEDASFVVSLMKAGAAAAKAFSVTSTGVVTLVNDETIDNSTNGTVTYTSPIEAHVNSTSNTITAPLISLQGAIGLKTCTIADGDATPDVTGCTVLTTSANTNPTAITDLDNPVVGAIYIIVGGSASNSSTIADSGNFALSTSYTATVDETLTLFVQADNDYIELTRSTN